MTPGAALRGSTDKLREEMAERARVERQLHQTQRIESLGRLAGGIAHDFNNLLGAILGHSTMLQRRVADEDPIQPMLSGITEAAQVSPAPNAAIRTMSPSLIFPERQASSRAMGIDAEEVLP